MAEILKLKASRKKTIFYLFISIIFDVIGLLMIQSDKIDVKIMGWIGLIFFIIGTIVMVINIFNPNMLSLTLNQDGFKIKNLRGVSVYRWKDLKEIKVGKMSKADMVMFNFKPSYVGGEAMRDYTRSISGYEGSLPDNYAMKPKELANLMEKWRKRYS